MLRGLELKRVLFTLMMLAAVLSVAGAGSLAYFSDTETSSGNTFTAGTCGPATIDIMPGSFPNFIDPDSKDVIPVAILTTPDFDAATVNAGTVRFGPAGAWAVGWHFEHVDNDGDLDMILYFRTQDTGIRAGDTEAWLVGRANGWEIRASDSVTIVSP
jgi:predicted ribosomally synthesized peptide with SipW-like signal peptide